MSDKSNIRKSAVLLERPRRGPKRQHRFDQMNVRDIIRLETSYKSAHTCMRTFRKRYQPKWEFVVVKIDEGLIEVQRVK